jgi:hypothetical protein
MDRHEILFFNVPIVNFKYLKIRFKEFITVCWKDGKPYQAIYSVQGQAEILNPTLESLYPVLRDVLNEFKSIFPDEYIHLGNDEVYYDCW